MVSARDPEGVVKQPLPAQNHRDNATQNERFLGRGLHIPVERAGRMRSTVPTPVAEHGIPRVRAQQFRSWRLIGLLSLCLVEVRRLFHLQPHEQAHESHNGAEQKRNSPAPGKEASPLSKNTGGRFGFARSTPRDGRLDGRCAIAQMIAATRPGRSSCPTIRGLRRKFRSNRRRNCRRGIPIPLRSSSRRRPKFHRVRRRVQTTAAKRSLAMRRTSSGSRAHQSLDRISTLIGPS